MPHDKPDLHELVRTVSEFIEGVSPRLDGLDRYHAMCAVYLLEIAQRELGQWQRVPGADEARLRGWLGVDAAVPAEQLTTMLCARIKDGEYDDDMEALHALLLAHVEDKVATSKPEVLARRGGN